MAEHMDHAKNVTGANLNGNARDGNGNEPVKVDFGELPISCKAQCLCFA